MNRYHVKKMSDCPCKSYGFLKIHHHYVNRNFILCNLWFIIWRDLRPPHKTGFCVFTCLSCGGADRRNLLFVMGQGRSEKLMGLLSQWQLLGKLFSLDIIDI
jgi:hypothetical protein